MPNHAPPSPKSPCAHKLYQLSCDDYDRLMEHAGGACQICGFRGFLVVDHDAGVGDWAVRGLLCGRCNRGIPFGSAPAWATEYLADPWWRRDRIDEARAQRRIDVDAAELLLPAVAAAAEAYTAARAALEGAILAALRAPGAAPTKVAKASPWTAATVRKLARKAGIPAPYRGRGTGS